MIETEKESKKRSFINKFTVGAAFCLVGGLLFLFGSYDYYKYKNSAKNINELSINELESGMIVEGDIEYNLGAYAERAAGSIEHIFYLIPINNNGYISFHAKFDDINVSLDKQFNEYIAYLQGGNSPQTIVHIKGKVKKLTDSDEKKYMKDYLGDSEYKDSCIFNYYIDDFDEKVSKVISAFGRIIFFVGVFIIILGIEKKTRKNNFGIPINK